MLTPVLPPKLIRLGDRALDPSRGIQAHRRRGGQVEALRLAQDRDPDDVIDSREDLVGKAMGLVAQDPGEASGQQPLIARR